MGDLFWLGAAAVAVAAGVVVAALVNLVDRRARRKPARPSVQLVREQPPLDESKVLGRIARKGQR